MRISDWSSDVCSSDLPDRHQSEFADRGCRRAWPAFENKIPMKKRLLILPMLLILCGCANGKHNVIAATGTSIGLEVAQNPSTQMYQIGRAPCQERVCQYV